MIPTLSSPFAWIASHAWLYPALEVVHLIGVALLIGNLALLELRLWFAPADDPPAVQRAALGLVLAGFSLAALSGLTMFASQPGELIANRAFTLKMLLLMLAGCNAAAFHARGGLARRDALARAQTALSLLLWLAILACGRWIAYA
ncbi:MAG: hypothetical protein KGQ67_10440 [Betaproteobacteria bacterium]|nr:hypothetical protein [Betaproteobacteria bacterium]